MGKTTLRSFKDDIEEAIDNHTKNIAGITFEEFVQKITEFENNNSKTYKPLGSLKVFIPINKNYLFKTSNDDFKYYKRFIGIDDCYHFFILRKDRSEFILNLLYMNFQTDLYVKNEEEFYITLNGIDSQNNRNLLLDVQGDNEDINKRVHEFNNDTEYKYYELIVPVDLLNLSNTLSISFFNKNEESIFYYQY